MKTDRLHDLRLLSCYWRSWYRSWLRWFFSITLCDDNVREFNTRWDEIILSMSKIPSDDVLASLYKFRERLSDQLKTVLELYDMEFHQKISMPNYERLKTMVKRSKDQKLQLWNFDARHEKIESAAVVKNRKGLIGVERGKGICYQWKENGQCSKGDQCSFRHESNDRAKPTPKNVFAVGALVTSEMTAEQRLRLTEDLRNLHPKENVLEIARMKSKKHRNTCHWGRLIWDPSKCCQTTGTP